MEQMTIGTKVSWKKVVTGKFEMVFIKINIILIFYILHLYTRLE